MNKDISIDEVDWEDAALLHCQALLTLAGLLLESGVADGTLPAGLIQDTGALIDREARQLRELVKSRNGREVAR